MSQHWGSKHVSWISPYTTSTELKMSATKGFLFSYRLSDPQMCRYINVPAHCKEMIAAGTWLMTQMLLTEDPKIRVHPNVLFNLWATHVVVLYHFDLLDLHFNTKMVTVIPFVLLNEWKPCLIKYLTGQYVCPFSGADLLYNCSSGESDCSRETQKHFICYEQSAWIKQ